MRFVIGITGASGLIYAEHLLRYLSSTEHKVDVIVSAAARRVSTGTAPPAR